MNFIVLYLKGLTYVDARAKIAFLPRRRDVSSFLETGAAPESRSERQAEISEQNEIGILLPNRPSSFSSWPYHTESQFVIHVRYAGGRDTAGPSTGAGAPSENSAVTENEKRGGGRAS